MVVTNTTSYRANFTDEERKAYNKYMVAKMQEYRKTPAGREMVNRNNKISYYRRKEKLAALALNDNEGNLVPSVN